MLQRGDNLCHVVTRQLVTICVTAVQQTNGALQRSQLVVLQCSISLGRVVVSPPRIPWLMAGPSPAHGVGRGSPRSPRHGHVRAFLAHHPPIGRPASACHLVLAPAPARLVPTPRGGRGKFPLDLRTRECPFSQFKLWGFTRVYPYEYALVFQLRIRSQAVHSPL